MVEFEFINVANSDLSRIISNFWVVQGKDDSNTGRLLLPMDHVDLVLTLTGEYVYNNNLIPAKIHFHGIRENPVEVWHTGEILAIGVSFMPWGFYPVIREKLSNFTNLIVDLKSVNPQLAAELEQIRVNISKNECIAILEKTLAAYINVTGSYECDVELIEELLYSDFGSIKEYIASRGISARSFERLFSKYIGVSPKNFMNIVKFENTTRDIITSTQANLTEIAQECGYFDQSHFIRHFKNYTGYSPGKFKQALPARKQHFNYKTP